MNEDVEKVFSDLRELAKRLNVKISIDQSSVSPLPRRKYVIRFTMKRRWGGEKKYAYECTLGTLDAYIAQIERSGGKIVGID